MFAPASLVPASSTALPVVVRLIGDLDRTLIAQLSAFAEASGRTPLLVHAGDADPVSERDAAALLGALAALRASGLDVRLDTGTSIAWRRRAKRAPGVTAVEATQRSAARRMVILAHSARRTTHPSR